MRKHEVVLGGSEGERIRVQVSGRQRPDAFEGDDVNWLQALVDVRAGGFAGAVSCSLRNDDLADFRDALAGLTDGRREVARFRTMEDQLGVEVRSVGAGQLLIEGHVSGAGNRLECRIAAATADLIAVLQQIDTVLDAFPVR